MTLCKEETNVYFQRNFMSYYMLLIGDLTRRIYRLVKFIKDTTPILNSIVSNEESRATITQLSSDIMDIMKVVSTLQNIEDVRSIGLST